MTEFYSLYPGYDSRLDFPPLTHNVYDIPEGRAQDNEFIVRLALSQARIARENPDMSPEDVEIWADMEQTEQMFTELEAHDKRLKGVRNGN